ncbi:MAG TPA: sigma-70 family RNA polymerase sigma factor [Thermoanaerobaculia bacterium]|jgi:RNA polymerase sigma factor (sigma-70 family)
MQRVLVVDDDPVIVEALVTSLSLEEFDVVGVHDRAAAEERIASEFFPIILTDLRMRAEDDGLQLLDAVARLSPRSRVATMTAYAAPGMEQEILSRGAALVLFKPFNVFETARVLREMLAAIEHVAPASDADIETLYTSSLPLLFGIARKRFGLDRDDAEELVQESWCLFLEQRAKVMQPRAWLAGTIANLCRQQITRRVKSRAEVRAEDAPELAYEVAADAVLIVGQLLERVDERTRALAELIGIERLSYDEVSTALRIPLGSVGPLYIRARKRMRAMLSN